MVPGGPTTTGIILFSAENSAEMSAVHHDRAKAAEKHKRLSLKHAKSLRAENAFNADRAAHSSKRNLDDK